MTKDQESTLINYLKETPDLSNSELSHMFGVSERTIYRWKKALELRGFSPEHKYTKVVPESFVVRGVSQLLDRNGNVQSQWVKSELDKAQVLETAKKIIKEMNKDLPVVDKIKRTTKELSKDLLACYPLGDPHIGMLAWGKECGADWDLGIAEKYYCSLMDEMVKMGPACGEALIVNLGDYFHYDNFSGLTERSKNVLDRDGRYFKMVSVGIKIMRQCIETCLKKHGKVKVINVIGNHDETGAIWLSQALNCMYSKNPRVEIDLNPRLVSVHQHGKTLIAAHHGHTIKAPKLPGVIASDYSKMWGETDFRYALMGHIHSNKATEYPGIMVESFNTVAPKDEYAASHGYRAGRNLKGIFYSKTSGEMARLTLNINENEIKL